jgi:hypothetical protein
MVGNRSHSGTTQEAGFGLLLRERRWNMGRVGRAEGASCTITFTGDGLKISYMIFYRHVRLLGEFWNLSYTSYLSGNGITKITGV